ncbi:MAG: MoxR family ATPase [Defluviitaleaceae bacterium]|nr:MoxR family ATPase [Defluviitaleaceae bacterium]
MEIIKVQETINSVVTNIETVILGKAGEIKLVLAALLAGGHVLLEDVPGTGKTVLAKSLARSFDCDFSRVQFTPDLLPSELTGINFFSPKTGDFTFREGSLFSNIILADEINRATPRTQSGLLESMEERQITVDGTTYQLPAPYFVIATQNPVETQGTFPLPEAQMDRFLLQLNLGYPIKEDSVEILKRFVSGEPLKEIKAVCSSQTLLELQKAVKDVYIHEDIYKYIVDLAQGTRTHEGVALGISTRGILALAKMAQAYCAINGRGFVTPQDVLYLVPYVFPHRIVLKGGVRNRQSAVLSMLDEIIANTTAPVEDWKSADPKMDRVKERKLQPL